MRGIRPTNKAITWCEDEGCPYQSIPQLQCLIGLERWFVDISCATYALPDTVFLLNSFYVWYPAIATPAPIHAHEYKEKHKQEKLPRFALWRCRRQSLALLLALGFPIGEEARFLRAKASVNPTFAQFQGRAPTLAPR